MRVNTTRESIASSKTILQGKELLPASPLPSASNDLPVSISEEHLRHRQPRPPASLKSTCRNITPQAADEALPAHSLQIQSTRTRRLSALVCDIPLLHVLWQHPIAAPVGDGLVWVHDHYTGKQLPHERQYLQDEVFRQSSCAYRRTSTFLSPSSGHLSHDENERYFTKVL